ncbi:DUF2911 domain-containing protein [Chitinophagaceae bacterium LWZ2-11]
MKKLLLLALVACSLGANAQIKMPAASAGQTIVQDFGLGKLEISYSRPNIKGRPLFKENSELAPLGKVWRTGANGATKIKITDPVSIGGHALDTGSYAIFTIPGKSDWTIILNKDSKNWGTQYEEKDDIFRFTVPAEKMKEAVETFTIQFANIKPESCELHLMWGNTAVSVPITTNIRDRVRKQVEEAVTADKVAPNTYFAAANFYYDLDKDYNKALANAAKATEANPKAYYMFILKAKIEKELGDKTSAKADAQKCIDLATEQKNDDYVRMGRELIGKL